MCTKKAPKIEKVTPAKAEEPVAPLVAAGETDPNEALRKKGKDALKVSTPSGASSGLNIP
jgi:hypothetical protein